MFDTIKKWFGSGKEPETRAEHSPQRQRRTGGRPAAAGQAPRTPPRTPPVRSVLTEVTIGEGGGVQVLDWFQHSMLRDSHGDCAQAFLEEEPGSRQQQEEGLEQQRRVPNSGDNASGKQQKRGALQNCSCRAKKVAGPSDMLVDRGNVYVVPHGS